MICSVGEANLGQKAARSIFPTAIAPGSLRYQCWDQDVFQDRALRQETVVLEDEPDLAIPEGRQFLLFHCEGILVLE